MLANFSHGFSKVLHRLYGTPVVSGDGDVKAWSWHEWMDGLTYEQEQDAWNRLPERFWLDLPCLSTHNDIARLNKLGKHHAISFITNRRASNRQDTMEWLEEMQFAHHHNVYTTPDKGRAAHFLGVHVAIDDSGPNVLDLINNDIYSVLLRRPYNESYVELIKARGGHVVDTFSEFLDRVNKLSVAQDEFFDTPNAVLTQKLLEQRLMTPVVTGWDVSDD